MVGESKNGVYYTKYAARQAACERAASAWTLITPRQPLHKKLHRQIERGQKGTNPLTIPSYHTLMAINFARVHRAANSHRF
jgi:hypothetical protein